MKIRWSDIRAAGALGIVWALAYAVGGALALYDWLVRQAGCTNTQSQDPSYICPSDARVFTVWGIFAATMLATVAGVPAIRARRPYRLIPIILVQLLVIVVLVWIARNPAFHVRRR